MIEVFRQVQRGELLRLWPEVEPYLSTAIAKTGSPVRTPQTLARVLAGKWRLWIAETQGAHIALALCTSIVDRDSERALLIEILGGDGLPDERLAAALEELEVYAAHHRCTVIEGGGRLGWERKLSARGWAKSWVTMRKEI